MVDDLADRYLELRGTLALLHGCAGGRVVPLTFDPQTGNLQAAEPADLERFLVTAEDAEPLTRKEFFERVARQDRARLAAEDEAGGAVPPRWIVFEDGERVRTVRLGPGEWTIGRSPDCDIAVVDYGCSRLHAKLIVAAQGIRIADLKSKGGTQVNSVPVSEATLGDGDTLRLGTFLMRYIDGSPDAPSAPRAAVAEARVAGGLATAAPAAEAAPVPAAVPVPVSYWWPVSSSSPIRHLLATRIGELAGWPGGTPAEDVSLGELKPTFTSLMFVVHTMHADCGVPVAWDRLPGLDTVGDVVTLLEEGLSAKLQAHLVEGRRTSSEGEWPRAFCTSLFAQQGALFLVSDRAFCWALSPTSGVVKVDVDRVSPSAEPEEDPRYVYAALSAASRRYPELNGLVPPRPPDVEECPKCGLAAADPGTMPAPAAADTCFCQFGYVWPL